MPARTGEYLREGLSIEQTYPGAHQVLFGSRWCYHIRPNLPSQYLTGSCQEDLQRGCGSPSFPRARESLTSRGARGTGGPILLNVGEGPARVSYPYGDRRSGANTRMGGLDTMEHELQGLYIYQDQWPWRVWRAQICNLWFACLGDCLLGN